MFVQRSEFNSGKRIALYKNDLLLLSLLLTEHALGVGFVEHSEGNAGQDAGEVEKHGAGHGLGDGLLVTHTCTVVHSEQS